MKIVAISGGNNSNIRKNGEPQIYEHEIIDKEIISLSGKKNPNVLFISHASDKEFEISSYNKIMNTYYKMYSCAVRLLSIDMLEDKKLTKKLVDWSDIIYVGGGNTKKMLELWKKNNFDKILISASEQGKVLCGISAGASCWFAYSCSDYLQMELNDPGAPFKEIEGLGIIGLVFNPHANFEGRLEGMREVLKSINKNGVSLSNNVAIEIINDEYKIIEGSSSENDNQFALLSYWENGEYFTKKMEKTGKIKQLIKNN